MTLMLSNMHAWSKSGPYTVGKRIARTPIFFSYIRDGNRTIVLKRRIVASVCKRDGLYFLENKELGMMVYDETFGAAKDSFEVYLLSLMENYLLPSGNSLAESGKEFRAILQEYFYDNI